MKVAQVFVHGWETFSAAGNAAGFARSLALDDHHLVQAAFPWGTSWIGPLSKEIEEWPSWMASERQHEDRTVRMARVLAQEAARDAGWTPLEGACGVVVGSSRGATEIWETRHSDFLKAERKVHPLTSPTTTLGNISSAVAQDLNLVGPECSISMTCSTTLHAILISIGMLQGGICTRMLAGGVEAALTPFSVAQMRALRIYTDDHAQAFPCRPLEPRETGNTFVLGEGGGVFALSSHSHDERKPVARIYGIGWGIEPLTTITSMTEFGSAFEAAQRGALEGLPAGESVSLIVAHATGTALGDRAERNAIDRVFAGAPPPLIYSPKWKVGHTLGASGALGLAVGLHWVNGGKIFQPAFLREQHAVSAPPARPFALINAAGFGGGACSVLIGLV
jgi:3-oxoacyl-[acyl-carrier-protein] synthase II